MKEAKKLIKFQFELEEALTECFKSFIDAYCEIHATALKEDIDRCIANFSEEGHIPLWEDLLEERERFEEELEKNKEHRREIGRQLTTKGEKE